MTLRFAARLAARREDRVLVLENRIFVDRAFLGIDKNNRHLQFVFSAAAHAARENRSLPNALRVRRSVLFLARGAS